MARLDLQPPGAAAPGGVGRLQRLHEHALVAGGQGRVEEGVGLGRVGDQRPRHPARRRHQRVEGRRALGAGAVDEVLAVDVQHVEEERRERRGGVGASRAEAARRDLEGIRAPVGLQRDRLAVEHDLARGQREHRLHHLGHARGDVVEAAREGAHVVAAAVDLQARAVELVLDGRRPGLRQRAVDVVARRREHRLDRAPDLEPDRAQRLGAAREGRCRRRAQVAAEHARPADRVARHLGRPRDRLDHDALLGALAQLAGQQCDEEALLGLGGAREERGQRVAPRRLRPGPRHRADRLARRVDLRSARAPPRPPARAGRAASGSPPRSDAGAARPTGRPPRSPPRRAPCGAASRPGGRSSRCARGSLARPRRWRSARPAAPLHRASPRTVSANAPAYVSSALAFVRRGV